METSQGVLLRTVILRTVSKRLLQWLTGFAEEPWFPFHCHRSGPADISS